MFKKYKKKLSILGDLQSKDFTKTLLDSLNHANIKKLRVTTKKLNLETVETFRKFKILESLVVKGESQTSSSIKVLLDNLNHANIRKNRYICQKTDTEPN